MIIIETNVNIISMIVINDSCTVNTIHDWITHACKKGVCAKSTYRENRIFKFSNAYNVISSYPLLTYEPMNMFTVQLPPF